jgi:hypothetical protein
MNIQAIYSSVYFTFIGLRTKEYIFVIFLGTEEFENVEENTLFSYSATAIPIDLSNIRIYDVGLLSFGRSKTV